MYIHPYLVLALLSAPLASAAVYSHYSFDADYTDSSANAKHGTLVDVGTLGNSGIVTTPGDFKFGGGAMNFSADRDYVSIPQKPFSSGSSYTIAFWARKAAGDTGDGTNWDMVIGDTTLTTHFIGLNDVTGTGLRWRGAGTDIDRQKDFAVAKDYLWHHYAVVALGTNLTLYVDGVFFGSGTGLQTGFQFNAIGEAYPSTSDFDFHGQIDEMWIFDEALTASRVAALYTSNDVDAAPTIAGIHYRFDGDFSDSGSASNPGLPAGTAATTTDPTAIAAGSGALALDGADGSYVSLTTPGGFTASQPWTIAWWARRGELGGNKGMVIGAATNTADFVWLNDSFTGLRFRSSNSVTLDFTSPKDQAMRHYALVANGAGGLALYLNGQLSQSLSGNTSIVLNTIGNAYPTSSHYNFQGTLDELHVIGNALDGSAVAQLYTAEKPTSSVTRLRIVLIGGQSNADGRAPVSELPTSPINLQNPQNDVDLFYRVEGGTAQRTTLRPGLSETGQFGPEIQLGRRLADLYAQEIGTRVAIIKYANGGTDLKTQWKAGGTATTTGDGPDYVIFQQTVTAGLAALAAAYPDATLDLQGMVWMQGETDAVPASSGLYQANLTNFIADIRATYGAALPFLIGRLSSKQTALNAPDLAAVRATQNAVAAADPRTAMIDTDLFAIKPDLLHFTGSGQLSLGSFFAEDSAYYSWMVATFSAADINAGLAEPGADPDGDGQSNRTEFLGASDPQSGASSFQAAISLTGPSVGAISYPTSNARRYSVQHFSEPTGTWETELPALRGTGATVVRPLSTAAARSLYRVKSELP